MERAVRKTVVEPGWEPVDFIHSGSTLLNLALSNKGLDGGWARGRVDNIVGDGSSGKTLLGLEAGANVYYNYMGNVSHNFPKVDNVEVILNNVEGVMDFPVESMYGKPFLADVVEKSIRTSSVEEFGRDFFRRVRALEDGTMMLYILDSWDALDSDEEYKAFLESVEKDKPVNGSYNLGKQSYGSKRFFKTLCREIEGEDGKTHKDVTLIIISQVRTAINVSFGKKKYRGGGDALNFYTHQVPWLRESGKIKQSALNEEFVKGVSVHAKVERNKTSLPFREANFDILFNMGIDDVTSNLKWLYGPVGKPIKFNGLEFKKAARYENVVKYIEEEGLEDMLVEQTVEKWMKIEEAIRPDRKRRFPD